MNRSTHLPILAALTLAGGTLAATRDMENLDRGLVAVKVSGGVFVSWRVLGTDPASLGFNVYRDGAKVNSAPITGATNLLDAAGTASATYTVRPVVAGAEQAVGGTAAVWASQTLKLALDRPTGGTTPDGVAFTYSPSDIAVGDLDGDGRWDLVVKWDPSNAKDNSQSGYTGNVLLDAYTLTGKKLWRIDLGPNIRAGAHYTQMLVGDYDEDGKAELAVKTAPGARDGRNALLSKGAAAGADHTKDYRNTDGYVLSGPEWITVFAGATGAELATANYVPGRGTVSGWGDNYGNRVDRFLATNAYLDGKKPSMVFQRGYYTRMTLTAWDWDGATLKQRWAYDGATSGQGGYGQGNHNLSAADVDQDGFDEILEGASAIDHDGKFMYRTGLGHGDAMHLGDLDPDNPGLEIWEVHEDANVAYGHELHDARTGKILWGENFDEDNGRGLAADIDATSPGYEMWSSSGTGVWSCKGKQLSTSKPSVNFRVYWDGDLQDELLDGNKIDKWNGSGTSRLATLTGSSCNGTKSTPNFSGDLLGDWREEVILHDDANLYVSTTTTLTNFRLYTLAHDPVYRLGMSWQNAAYNQPPHLGFWLGAGVDKAPAPDIRLVGGTSGTEGPGARSLANRALSIQRTSQGISVRSQVSSPGWVKVRNLAGELLASAPMDADGRALVRLEASTPLAVSFRQADGAEGSALVGF